LIIEFVIIYQYCIRSNHLGTVGMNYIDTKWFAEDVNNPGGTTIMISYIPAQAGGTAIVGDWNGDGRDSNGLWQMRVSNIVDIAENSVSFGQTGDIPLAIFEN
jgi:hypothetical protein